MRFGVHVGGMIVDDIDAHWSRIPLGRAIRAGRIFEGRLDVGRGERRAIVERDPLLQLELQGMLIQQRHAFGKFHDQLVGVVGAHRRACQIAEDEAFEVDLTEGGMRAWIPVAGQVFRGQKIDRFIGARIGRACEEAAVDQWRAGRGNGRGH